MKNKIILFSSVVLIAFMIAGGTMAWFTSAPEDVLTNFEIGTIEVDVIGNDVNTIILKNAGTIDSYVRVRLVPKWSNSSLSVSNIKINIDKSWIESNGYYYYTKPLEENEITSNLLENIEVENLTSEYAGESFTIKVVAEGVQSTHEAWVDIWSINRLPF